jgi:hypothetical protein
MAHLTVRGTQNLLSGDLDGRLGQGSPDECGLDQARPWPSRRRGSFLLDGRVRLIRRPHLRERGDRSSGGRRNLAVGLLRTKKGCNHARHAPYCIRPSISYHLSMVDYHNAIGQIGHQLHVVLDP